MRCSACRTSLSLKDRASLPTGASWERSPPLVYDRSSPRNSRPPALPCPQLCLNILFKSRGLRIRYVSRDAVWPALAPYLRGFGLGVEAHQTRDRHSATPDKHRKDVRG